MATGFEKLDKQLDRLEKLFSRRKRSAEPYDLGASGYRPATPIPFLAELGATSQTFPQPSYIRPTSSRMVAREEVLLTPNSARRARSLPESPSTSRLPVSTSSTDIRKPICPETPEKDARSSPSLSPLGPDIPKRSSSLFTGGSANDTLSELLGFSFPAVPKETTSSSPPRRRSRSTSKSTTRSFSGSVSPKARVDRKRYSGGEIGSPLVQQQETAGHQIAVQKKQPVGYVLFPRESQYSGVAPRVQAAAPPSPRLMPLLEPELDELDDDSNKICETPRGPFVSRAAIKHHRTSMRKSRRFSKLPVAKRPNQDPILKEPSVTDFLALSDDDIADEHTASRTLSSSSKPPTFALPPDPSSAATPRRAQASHPLLTLSPPLASRPAASAAFEAARIATKYHFDLVYVVNLWPAQMLRPSRSSPLNQMCGTPVATSPTRLTTPTPPPASPVSYTSGDDSASESHPQSPRDSARSGMTGRLLAAYGLPAIMSPFRISAPVHQKVLRTEGWLEYRNETGAQDEFARGYSCSFYTGYSPSRRRDAPQDTVTTPDGKRRKLLRARPANRGIVFAAFRMPREDGAPCGGCSTEELDALYKDAEALVDMLIEIHMTQRQRSVPGTPLRCMGGGSGRAVTQGAPLIAT